MMKGYLLKIAYGFIGTLLLSVYLATGVYGISIVDRECYQRALALQEYVDTLGFKDFNLIDYPVAVYTGDKEYVMQGDSVTPRKSVLGTLAGTAFKVDGHYEALVPSFNDMKNIGNAVGFADNPGNISSYGASEQVSAIWHESFHAW